MTAVIDVEEIVVKPCRICGKPFSIAHAFRAHPVQWHNYIASKIDFGASIYEAIEPKSVSRPKIRS